MKDALLKVKGILFDLDGTVIDSRQAYLEAAKAAYQTTKQKMPDLKTVLEIPRRLEQRKPLDDLIGADTPTFLEVYLKKFNSITRRKTRPFPNIGKALHDLSRNAKLALITMRFVPKTAIITDLKYFGLSEYFTCVLTALDTPNTKPSPEALIRASKLLGVEAYKCVIVGDSISDVKAGKAAGILTVAVLSGLFSREELTRENPDLILDNASDLPRHVAFPG